MNLGKVVGTVVATRKEPSLDGLKFMLVKHVDSEGKETGGQVVAVDAVGVGPGELVLVATGSSARQTLATKDRPCDAVIMAIVDTWEIGGAAAQGEKVRRDFDHGGPVRVALTGSTVSEPVNELLAVVGRDQALARLRAAAGA
jgi:microcompartment protein CcmK/EutM